MSLLDALLLDPPPFDVWIALRTDGAKGSGTQSDPYDGSSQQTFDGLMNGFPANTAIHLGPGTFQTQGYSPNIAGGWQPRPGQRITGSGIEVTTLKVVNASDTTYLTVAIGNNPFTNFLYGFELADLTVDCNMAAHAGLGV